MTVQNAELKFLDDLGHIVRDLLFPQLHVLDFRDCRHFGRTYHRRAESESGGSVTGATMSASAVRDVVFGLR